MDPKKIDFTWDESGFGVRAAGVMLDSENRVLLCKVADDPDLDFWVLPGGGCTLHETSVETVRREFLEEANFEIDVQRLLWIEENYFVMKGKKIHGIGFYFLVTPNKPSGVWEQEEFNGQEADLDPDRVYELAFRWFKPAELTELEFYPVYLKKILRSIPEHPLHVIHKDYDED